MIGAIISGVGALASAGLSAYTTAKQNKKDRAFNAQQAQLNRNFQEQMSNTAYQRAVTDMQSAGLNPALAYQQGGASSLGGSMASFRSQGYQHSAQAVANAFGAVGQALTARSEAMSAYMNARQALDDKILLNDQRFSSARDIEYLKKALGHVSYRR